MKQGKYDKYFISETRPNLFHPQTRNRQSEFPWINYPISIDQEADGKVKGAFWFEPNIIVRAMPPGKPGETGGRPHYHDFDEYLLLLGLDPNNLADLGGEVEFWMGDGDDAEKHIITKTTAVFVPRGMLHLPMFIRRVDRPFGFIGVANTVYYHYTGFSNDPRHSQKMMFDEIIEYTAGGQKHTITKSQSDYLEYMMNAMRPQE